MKKIIKIMAFLALMFVVLFIGSFYYFFKYPKQVTMAAFDSIEIGTHVPLLFSSEQEFISAFEKSNMKFLHFTSKDHSQTCLVVHMRSKDELSLMEGLDKNEKLWQGNLTELSTALKQQESKLVGCEQFCLIFMPSLFYRGSFCVVYDENLKIISKENPRFWD